MTDEVLATTSSDQGYATASSDFLFVIDCTATMQWVLDTICQNLKMLVAIFGQEKLRMRYGVLEFRDRKYARGESSKERALEFHEFKDSKFTDSVEEIGSALSSLVAEGGGPPKESVLDALKHAVEDPDWRDDATRVVVLFTDALPYTPDVEVRDWEEAIDIIEESQIDMLHMVIPVEHHKQYEKLRLAQTKDGEDLPGELLPLGASTEDSERLRKVLEGIGYSSGRQAAMNNAKKGFRGT